MGSIFSSQTSIDEKKAFLRPITLIASKKLETKVNDYCDKINKLGRKQNFSAIIGVMFVATPFVGPMPAEYPNRVFMCKLKVEGELKASLDSQDGIIKAIINGDQVIQFYKILKSLYIYFAHQGMNENAGEWDVEEISFEDEICCLCMTNRVSFYGKCSHSFCKQCSFDWFKKKSHLECPVCRKEIGVSSRNSSSSKMMPLEGFKIIGEEEDNEYTRLMGKLTSFLKDATAFGINN